jgi:hypothetical protein
LIFSRDGRVLVMCMCCGRQATLVMDKCHPITAFSNPLDALVLMASGEILPIDLCNRLINHFLFSFSYNNRPNNTENI